MAAGGWLAPLAALAGLAALAQAPLLIGASARALALPLEPLVAGLLLLALPAGRGRRLASALALGTAALLTAAWLLLAMERTAFTLLGRPLKLWLDLQLVRPGLELISGAMGLGIAVAVALGLLVLPLVVFWAFARLCRTLQGARAPRLATAGAALALAGMSAVPQLPPLTGSELSRAVAFQVERLQRVASERQAFAEALAADPLAGPGGLPELAGLAGADVVLVFVESYGAAALEDPRYAPRLRGTLAATERGLAGAGLAQASGWLASPTIGGQSWLAHASLTSGLWVDSQDRWDLLVASRRRLLPHVFAAAGYDTALVMPAIVKAWPEAGFFGFQRTYFRDQMGYAGPPYAWVTMPDQYSLAVLERELLAGAARAPLFAQVALISSHAPWTPVPPVLDDWSEIADGAGFARWSEPPIPPRELWLDADAVRAAYAEALDYVLRTLASWLRQPWDRPRLVVILGDHEAGAVVSGEGAESVVPLHVVSDRPDLVLRLVQAGLAEGLVPPPRRRGSIAPLMSDFRSLFLDAFAGPGTPRPLGEAAPAS